MACPSTDSVVTYLASEPDASTRDAIEAHVDGCPDCRALIAALVASKSELDRVSRGAISADARPVTAPTVGRYVLIGVVGAGAMGIVYRARDPELGRDVALKILRPVNAMPGLPTAIAEARAMASIEHPHVVRIYDVGAMEGRLYLAMELVDGETLRDYFGRTRRPWRETVELVLQAGEGLAEVHRRGIVHGDFKPDNVFVAEEPRGFRVLVGDFGLATSCTPTLGRASTPPLLVGTPAYMAPELLAGHRPSEEGDQFAFCVTTFELLHGVRPFSGTDEHSLRDAIETGRIHCPKRSSVPAALAAVLRKGLSVDPVDRYPSLTALLIDISRSIARRRRVPWRAALVGGLTLAAVGWWAVVASPPPAPCDLESAGADEFPGQFDRAAVSSAIIRERPFARGIADHVVGDLERWAHAWQGQAREACAARADVARFDARAQCLMDRRDELQKLLAALDGGPGSSAAIDRLLRLDLPRCSDASSVSRVEPELRAQLLDVVVANWTGDYELAASSAEQLLARDGTLVDPAFTAAVRAELGRAQVRFGDAQVGISTLERAVLDARAAGADEIVARGGALLVMVLDNVGRGSEVDIWLRHAEASALGTGEPLVLATVDYVAGAVAHRRGELVEARGRYTSAISRYEGALGPGTAAAFEVLEARAHLDVDQGHLDDALAGFEQVLSIAEATWGTAHSSTAIVVGNMAPVLYARGQAARAERLLHAVLAGEGERLGADHPDLGFTHTALGLLSRARGDFASATEHFEACLALHRARPTSPTRPDALECRLQLAETWVAAGSCDRALDELGGIADGYAELGEGPQYKQRIARALFVEAICRGTAEAEGSEALLQRVVAMAGESSVDARLLARAEFELARVRWTSGRRDVRTFELAEAAADRLRHAAPEAIPGFYDYDVLDDAASLAEMKLWLAVNAREIAP